MNNPISRRDVLKLAAAQGLASLPGANASSASILGARRQPGWIRGLMTGAAALTAALQAEGCCLVFGIPGAQENELWDTFKTMGLPYHLVTHEFSAAAGADGYARSTGRPGVLCVVPGPGITNALGGLGEALLDSIPIVCIVGDVAQGDKYRPFQVHSLPNVQLCQSVCKEVFNVCTVDGIPGAVRDAFRLAQCGEPGPVAVVVPYNLLTVSHHFNSGPLEPCAIPVDDAGFQRALGLLSDQRLRVGIYAGLGCMDYSPMLTQVAEKLQAPVATSLSGKGAIAENHPLAVGWGYGPQGTQTAEETFKHVDLLLAIGVRYSEVSTGFYAQPRHRHLIHVDVKRENIGRIMPTEVCVNEDAGHFLGRLLECPAVARPCNPRLPEHIHGLKVTEARKNADIYARCGCDPMAFLLALRRCSCPDALVYVDVTVSQFWCAEVFTATGPRTWFMPSNNQSMGWAVGAALGGQLAWPGRQTIAIVGDGCFLMSAMETSTAARAGLPVKFFVLDDQAYHFMQDLQRPAYVRTTATMLARLDYQALAQGLGLAYREICSTADVEAGIREALAYGGPVLTRVVTDYSTRPVRWVSAVRQRFIREMTPEQRLRFAARVGARSLELRPNND